MPQPIEIRFLGTPSVDPENPGAPPEMPAAAQDNGPPAPIEQSPQGGGSGWSAPLQETQTVEGWSAPLLPESPIDYKTGGSFGLRVGMQRADNPKEAEALMHNTFGEENTGQDKKGNWFYLEGDKKIAVFPDEAPSSVEQMLHNIQPVADRIPMPVPLGVPVQMLGKLTEMVNAIAPRLKESVVAAAAPFAGTTAGALAGAPFAPPFGGMVGAGVGYGIGKGLDELTKEAQGFRRKDLKEEVEAIVGPEAAMNMLMPANVPSRSLLKGKFLGVTPESSRMAREVMEEGAIPPVGSVATEASGLEMKRKLSKDVSGDALREQNTKWLEDQVMKFLQSTGIDPHDAQGLIGDMWRGSTAVEGKHAAQSIVDAAARQHSMLSRVADSHISDAKQLTTQVEDLVRNWAAQAPETLGQDIGGLLGQARGKFSQDMKKGIQVITKMTGDTPVVPMDDAISAAKAIKATAPPQGVPSFIESIAAMPSGTRISLEQGHEYRTFARDVERQMLSGGNMTPRPGYHYYDEIEKALDNAISTVAADTPGDVGRALKAWDKQYAEGVVTFKNATARKIIGDIQMGQTPQPWEVASEILEKGGLQAVKAVRKHMPPASVEQISQAFIDNMIRMSSTELTPQSTQLVINPAALLKNLERYDPVMKQWGMSPAFRAEMKEFANTLRATDGQLDPQFLRDGPIRQKLAEWKVANAELDAFVKKDPLGAFRSGTPANKNKAIGFLLNPPKGQELRPFMMQLSPDERTEVHQFVVSKLFNDVLDKEHNLLKTVDGKAIKTWLSRYTQEQQDALLPYGLGNDLSRLGDKVAFVFPTDELAHGGSQAAVSVTSKGFFNPNALRKRLGWLWTTLAVHNQPVLTWLADLAERDPTAAKLVMGGMSRWMANAAMTDPRTGTLGFSGGGTATPKKSPITGNHYVPNPKQPGGWMRVDN